MSQWCHTLDATVPKCLSEGKQFALVKNLVSVWKSRLSISHADILGKAVKRDQPAFRNTRVINNMVSVIFSNSNVLHQ